MQEISFAMALFLWFITVAGFGAGAECAWYFLRKAAGKIKRKKGSETDEQ